MDDGRIRRLATGYVIPGLIMLSATGADIASGYAEFTSLNFNGILQFAATTFVWTGLLSVPWLLFRKKARFFYCPIMVWLLLSCCVQWVSRLKFGMNLGGEFVGILLTSSSGELENAIGEFLTPITCVAGSIAVICLMAIALLYWNMRQIDCGWINWVVSIALIAMFALWNAANLSKTNLDRGMRKVCKQCPTAYFIYDTAVTLNYRSRIGDLQRHPVIPPGLDKSGRGLTAVFVLGESATRNRWSLYGYERETTPKMSSIRDELIVFSDLVGSSYNTAEAEKFLFTEATQADPYKLNCTLSQLLSSAGFNCALFSNQCRWADCNTGDLIFFDRCNPREFMSEKPLSDPTYPFYDDVLLRYLESHLQHCTSNWNVVFLHLRGSHFPFTSTSYPTWAAKFEPETFDRGSKDFKNLLKARNNYDNTIWFTDWLLGEVVSLLRKVNHPTMMFYLSDHGESVDSDHWRKLTDRNLWELPMVCWLSPEFRTAHPDSVKLIEQAKDRPLQIERLLPGLVSLFGISGYGLKEDNFLDDNYRQARRMIQKGEVDYDAEYRR